MSDSAALSLTFPELAELERLFVAKLRGGLDTLSTERLDEYRRLGESYRSEVVIGDLTGDELANICDDEIALRVVLAQKLRKPRPYQVSYDACTDVEPSPGWYLRMDKDAPAGPFSCYQDALEAGAC